MDFGLESFQRLFGTVSMFRSGYGELLSNRGIVITSKMTDAIGKPAHELGDGGGDEIRAAISAGKPLARIGPTDAHGPATYRYYAPVLVGLVSIFLLSLIVLIAVTRLVKPLKYTADALKDVSEGGGDLTRSIPSHQGAAGRHHVAQKLRRTMLPFAEEGLKPLRPVRQRKNSQGRQARERRRIQAFPYGAVSICAPGSPSSIDGRF